MASVTLGDAQKRIVEFVVQKGRAAISEIWEGLQMDRGQVSNAVRGLVEMEVLDEEEDQGRKMISLGEGVTLEGNVATLPEGVEFPMVAGLREILNKTLRAKQRKNIDPIVRMFERDRMNQAPDGLRSLLMLWGIPPLDQELIVKWTFPPGNELTQPSGGLGYRVIGGGPGGSPGIIVLDPYSGTVRSQGAGGQPIIMMSPQGGNPPAAAPAQPIIIRSESPDRPVRVLRRERLSEKGQVMKDKDGNVLYEEVSDYTIVQQPAGPMSQGDWMKEWTPDKIMSSLSSMKRTLDDLGGGGGKPKEESEELKKARAEAEKAKADLEKARDELRHKEIDDLRDEVRGTQGYIGKKFDEFQKDLRTQQLLGTKDAEIARLSAGGMTQDERLLHMAATEGKTAAIDVFHEIYGRFPGGPLQPPPGGTPQGGGIARDLQTRLAGAGR